MSNINDKAKEAIFGGTNLCKEHGNVAKACPYCTIKELEQRLAIKDDAIRASQLVNDALTDWCKTLEQQLEEWKGRVHFSWDKEKELQAKNVKLVEALEILSKLGNGDKVGNSIGNQIAAEALKEVKGE